MSVRYKEICLQGEAYGTLIGCLQTCDKSGKKVAYLDDESCLR